MDDTNEFISAFKSGRVCLHPTDTIPGLCFDPLNDHAKQTLENLKGRETNKGFVCLVGSLEKARALWCPLPEIWIHALSILWPGPLTVVWFNETAPANVLDPHEKTLALRCPKLSSEHAWFKKVLQTIDSIIPSTSCNKSQEPPKTTWPEARDFALTQNQKVYIPPHAEIKGQENQKPSTIVRIFSDGSYKMLRTGPVTAQDIDKLIL